LVIAGLLSLGTLAQAGKPLELPVDGREIDRAAAAPPVSYAAMLEKTTPAVVAVHTAEVVRVVRSSGMPQDDILRRFFGLPTPRQRPLTEDDVEEQRVPQGVGSGVIVSKDGYILTNNHVVMDQRGGDADEVLVQLNDGRELPAEIVGRDPKSDVALIKVDAKDLPAIRITDSDHCKVGDIVFAIGNPMGVGLTVTQGIVSATGRSIGIYGREGYENFIQTDASINRGNSGGALVDIEGRLLGINSAILSLTGGNMGIGFAIPSNMAVSVAGQLTEFGEVRRGFLGVSISEISPDMAEAFGLENAAGVLVDEVEKESPADKAGLKRGDVIRKINGKPSGSPNELRLRVAQAPPGSRIRLDVVRDGEAMELKAEVVDRSQVLGGIGNEWLDGVTVGSLDGELRENLGIPERVQGVVIREVDPSSGYARFLRPGLVIMEVNDRRVQSVDEAKRALRPGVNKLYVYDRGRTGYLALRLEDE
jgi:Do/DeqQ family serine protease